MSDFECSPASTLPEQALALQPAAWSAVFSLSFGVFGLVTADFLPVSLLTPMAADLGVSNGAAGQAMTATAVVAVCAGPLLVLGSHRLDRRSIVWTLMALLAVSSVLTAFATGITMLLLARALLGFALGGFWAMMASLALRLVAPPDVQRAMSMIVVGVSLATVAAAPLGASLGAIWGWRARSSPPPGWAWPRFSCSSRFSLGCLRWAQRASPPFARPCRSGPC